MDKELEIQIKTTADTGGAEAVGDKLDQLKAEMATVSAETNRMADAAIATEKARQTETARTADAAIASEQAVQAETKRTFASKRDLKDAVKGLANEFPIIASVARMALNPITLVVTGIAGAFALWKTRVDNLSRALGGIAMPDVSDQASDRLEKIARQWRQLGDTIAGVATQADKTRVALKSAVDGIQFDESLQAALGLKQPGRAAAREAEAKEAAAREMEADARRRLAAAGAPGSKEAEAEVARKYAKAATQAEEDKKAAEARRDDLLEARDNKGLKTMLGAPSRIIRYGLQLGKSREQYFEDNLARERENITSQQAIIDSAERFTVLSGERQSRRDARARAERDLSEADALRREAGFGLGRAAVERAEFYRGRAGEAGARIQGALQSGNLLSAAADMPQIALAIAQLSKAIVDANAAIQRDVAATQKKLAETAVR